jgi:hypothetical protein
MRVSRLINDDWTFGKGLANYVANSEAIRQNVVTRLRSFANDWFLDVTAEIDWFNILGNRNNQEIIESEVRRVVLATDGVLTIDKFAIVGITDRDATIQLSITTIFDDEISILIGIPE